MVTPRSPLGQGGVERHVREVSTRMAAAGIEVEVLCADAEIERERAELHAGVLVRTVRAWPRGRDYFLAPAVWSRIDPAVWDIVHVQSYHTLVAPLAMGRALRCRLPYVVTFHGGGHSSQARNRLRGMQMRLLGPLLRRAARLVAVARFEIEEYGSMLRIPGGRFALIPNGTELEPADESLPAAEPEGTTLATIGRLERYKGHHRVLDALPTVLRQDPSARLLVVGTGPYEAELRRRAEELGVDRAVEFTSVEPGDPGGMAKLLGGVSVVVLMSEFETHPLVALEAAAARRRIVVADASGLREIAADGFAHPVDPASTPEQIGAAILEELSKPLPQRAPDLFSWDDCTTALIDLYGSILGSEHTSSGRANG